MIQLSDPLAETLQPHELKDLVAVAPPCVTLFLPPYRPAGTAHPPGAVLKGLIQELTGRLAALKIPGAQAQQIIEPLDRLVDDSEFARGTQSGQVIFRSCDYFRKFEVPEIERAAAFAGGSFMVRPLLGHGNSTPHFFILKLSQKRADLMRCGTHTCQPVPFPKGVPYTLEEAMAFKPPDHDLENRSSAGPSTGAMRGIRFGTGSGRETEHAHLADFYKTVDHAVHDVQKDGRAPLVLVGVEEDTSLYRSVASYTAVLERTVGGSPGGALSAQDIERQARAIVRSSEADHLAAELVAIRERTAPARFSTQLWPILKAAAEGRVSRLYLDENAERMGVFQEIRRGERWDWGEEDLLNLAAVETLARGGSAFTLATSQMPDQASIAAIFRY